MKHRYSKQFGWEVFFDDMWHFCHKPNNPVLPNDDEHRETLGETLDEEIPNDFIGLYL